MRRISAIGMLLLALGACKKKEDAPAPPAKIKEVVVDTTVKPPPPAAAGPEALVARFNACNDFVMAKEWAKLEGCFTADAKGAISDAQEFSTSKSIVEGLFKPFVDAFPDFKIEPQLILVNGKNLAAVMRFNGTNDGSLMGMPATHKKGGFFGMRSVTFVEDGSQMSWDLHVADLATLMAQLTEAKQPHRPVPEKGWDTAGAVVVASDSQTERDNLATVMKQCEAFNSHDTAALGAFWNADGVMHDMTGPADLVGWPAMEPMLKELFGALPDIKGTCNAWAAGDYVVAQVDWTATNTGDMPSFGLKKTGKPLKIHDSEIYQLKGGKIAHYWRFSNGMAFLMQLGLVPPPAPPPQK